MKRSYSSLALIGTSFCKYYYVVTIFLESGNRKSTNKSWSSFEESWSCYKGEWNRVSIKIFFPLSLNLLGLLDLIWCIIIVIKFIVRLGLIGDRKMEEYKRFFYFIIFMHVWLRVENCKKWRTLLFKKKNKKIANVDGVNYSYALSI